MKYDKSSALTIQPDKLTDDAFLQAEILGHSIVTIKQQALNTNEVETTACIYDVCSHHPEKQGYGKIIFNSVMQFIKDSAPIAGIQYCWLGIKLDNVLFDKVANIYISNGFYKGYMTEHDPWGQDLNFVIMSLHMSSKKDVVNAMTTDIELQKVLQLKNQYIDCLKNDKNYSTFRFTFDKNCIMHLRLLPFASHKKDNNRTVEPVQQNIMDSSMREMGGIFTIYNATPSDALNSVYTLSLTTIAEDDSIRYTVSKEELFSVMISISSYTFHTHPIQAYYHYKVLIAPPSGVDVWSFFHSYFIAPKLASFIVPQFHATVAIEGIYILSLHEEAITNIELIMQDVDNLSKLIHPDVIRQSGQPSKYGVFEYPDANRHFDWAHDNSNLDEDMVNKALTSYLTWFEGVNLLSYKNIRKIRLFKLQFIPWKLLNSEYEMEINCPLIHGNPYVDSKDYSGPNPVPEVNDDFYSSKEKVGLAKHFVQKTTNMAAIR